MFFQLGRERGGISDVSSKSWPDTYTYGTAEEESVVVIRLSNIIALHKTNIERRVVSHRWSES